MEKWWLTELDCSVQCIILSAVLASELQTMMEGLYERAVARKTELTNSWRVLRDGLNYIDRELNAVTAEMKDRICAMTEDVERKVGDPLQYSGLLEAEVIVV